MNRDKVVILPAYNEGRFISEIISELKQHTDASILAIDDGSTDDTYIKIKKSEVNSIRHSQNMGYGKALIEGFKFTAENNFRKVVTIDCDAQHEPQMVEEFFNGLDNYDIVSGSRYMETSPALTDAPGERVRINKIITSEINKITGYNLTDAFCGFKGYRVESLNKLKLTVPGYGLPVQVWIRAARAGLKVREIPVALIYHTRESFSGGLSSPEQRLEYYREIIKNEEKNQ